MPTALTFAQLSDHPTEFLKLQHYAKPSPGPDEVLIRMLASPINPQDLMVLAGKYPVKPHHTQGDEAVPGYDGVGEVIQRGGQVTRLTVGQWVIPKQHGQGTWRSHAVVHESSLICVSNNLDFKFAAVLKMCVTPAYLLLEDMRSLKPGDWILQNAASGLIGRMVVQFARVKGLRSINIVRDREDGQATAKMKDTLRELGADLVLTETEISELKEPLSNGRRIMLGLDAVFGAPGAVLAAQLSPNATYVNYGSLGTASSCFELTQESIFWKQITFKNFRLSTCLNARSGEEITDMIGWFVKLHQGGLLSAKDVDLVCWNVCEAEASREDLEVHLKRAVSKAAGRNVGEAKKTIFRFDYCQH
ncbi:MAG: hypothetical protein HETSPECPRED_007258 [Heterodermia speciosa]|uniref:enoyl-[acyl-carrier-protein] reductase n=1 Tax=Heterodermia speciosa TaxID=116794 RepID=A0A8H3IUW8_9LECA|nr:MAG: hypothetical protein HETSPECPRED_007258 [Heterodermia speciosa]